MKYSAKKQLIYFSLILLSLVFIILITKFSAYFKGAYVFIFIAIILFLLELSKFSDKKLNQFTNGQDAEDEVEDRLQDLPADYKFIIDVILSDKGNIDAIVIGRGGIFTIEVKSHWGKINFDGQELTINKNRLENNFLSQAYAQSMTVKNLIKEKLGFSVHVTPIIVFTRAKVNFGLNPLKGVYVINADWLNDFISQKNYNIGENDIEKIYNLIIDKDKTCRKTTQ